MIYVLWNVYQDAPLLERHVDRVDQIVNARHLFVDGKYPDFPEGPELSDDGTHEVADRHGVLIEAPAPEIEKRNLGLWYIDLVAVDGDWVLQLDADEELVSLDYPDSDEGIILFTRSNGNEYPRPHFWRWRPGIRYRGRHYFRYDDEGLVANGGKARGGVECGFGVHLDKSRSEERERAKKAYYRVLQEKEALYVEKTKL